MFTLQYWKLVFSLLPAIFFELSITRSRTPDNFNRFSIFLEGSSYRESIVISLFGENLKLQIDRKQPLLGLLVR